MKRKIGSLFFALILSFGLTACGVPTPGGSTDDNVKMNMTEEEAIASLKQLGLDQGFEILIETKDEDGVVDQITFGYKEDVIWIEDSAFKKVGNQIEIYSFEDGKYVYQNNAPSEFNFDTIVTTYSSVLFTAYQYADAYTSSKATTFLGRQATEYTYKVTVLTASVEWKYIVDNQTGITLSFYAKAQADGESGSASYEVKSFKIGNQVTVPELVKGSGPVNPTLPDVDPSITLKYTKTQAQDNVLALAQRGLLANISRSEDGSITQTCLGFAENVFWTASTAFKQVGDVVEMYVYNEQNGYTYLTETELADGVTVALLSELDNYLEVYSYAGSFVSSEATTFFNEVATEYIAIDADGGLHKFIVSDATGIVYGSYLLTETGRDQLVYEFLNILTGERVKAPILNKEGGNVTPDHPTNYADYSIRVISGDTELNPIPMALVDGKTDEYCALALQLKEDDLFEIHMASDDWRSFDDVKMSTYVADNFDTIPALGNFIRSKHSCYINVYVGVNADADGDYAGRSIWIEEANGQGQGGDPVVTPDYVIHHGKVGGEWVDVQMSLTEDGKEYYVQNVELESGDCFIIHMSGDDWRGYSDLKDSEMIKSCFTNYAADSNDIRVRVSGTYNFYVTKDNKEASIWIEFADEPGPGPIDETPDYVIHRGRKGESWSDTAMALTEGADEYYIQGIEFKAGDYFAIHMTGDDWRGYQNLKDSEFIKKNFGLLSEGDKAIQVKTAGTYDIYVTIAENGGKSIWIEASSSGQQEFDYWPDEQIAQALSSCSINGTVVEPSDSKNMAKTATVTVSADGTNQVLITCTYKDNASASVAAATYVGHLMDDCGYQPVLNQVSEEIVSLFKGEMRVDIYLVEAAQDGTGQDYFLIRVSAFDAAGYPSQQIEAFLLANEFYKLPSLENTSVETFQFLYDAEEKPESASLIMTYTADVTPESIVAEQQQILAREGFFAAYYVEDDEFYDLMIAPDGSYMVIWSTIPGQDANYVALTMGPAEEYFQLAYPSEQIGELEFEGVTETIPELAVEGCVYSFIPEEYGFTVNISLQNGIDAAGIMSEFNTLLTTELGYEAQPENTFVSQEGQININIEVVEDKLICVHFAFNPIELEDVSYMLVSYETWILNDDAVIYAWVWGGTYGSGQWVRCETWSDVDDEEVAVTVVNLVVNQTATGCILVRFNPAVENDFEDLNTFGDAFINDTNPNYARMSRYVWNKMNNDIVLNPEYSETPIEFMFNNH